MPQTIRDLIFAGINWLITHPTVLQPISHPAGYPITRGKIRTKYEMVNTSNNFDADLRDKIREDSSYSSMDDTTLQAAIDEANSVDEDITEPLGLSGPGDN